MTPGHLPISTSLTDVTRPAAALIRHPELCKRVIARIKNGWTPEQIAHRMIHAKAHPCVCQETIYRYVYAEDGMRQELWWHLPTDRKARRPRRARKRPLPEFHRDVSILFRPDDVARRRQFGHWEGDLMLFEQRFGQPAFGPSDRPRPGPPFERLAAVRCALRWVLSIMIVSLCDPGRANSAKIRANTPTRDQRTNRL